MCVYRYAYKGDWDGVGVYHLYAVGGDLYWGHLSSHLYSKSFVAVTKCGTVPDFDLPSYLLVHIPELQQ